MSNNCIPIKRPKEWRKLLADPDKQWKPGYSAYEIAHSWLAVNGFPSEVKSLFSTSPCPALQKTVMLLGIPEHKVYIPPHPGHASQNDLFVLAKAGDGELISITIEGKVAESFGPTLAGWKKQFTPGKTVRWEFLKEVLGLPKEPPSNVRYQLFHRMASAVVEARQFNAKYAVMIIQSFSPEQVGLVDFLDFVKLFGAETEAGQLVHLIDLSGISVYAGWAVGNPKSLENAEEA
jgi:hypothetical protein